MSYIVEIGAEAMRAKRRELINQPLERIWPDLMRAALGAMREPTEDMKNCHEEVHWGYSCYTCGGLTEGWYKMIDAALKEKSPATP